MTQTTGRSIVDSVLVQVPTPRPSRPGDLMTGAGDPHRPWPAPWSSARSRWWPQSSAARRWSWCSGRRSSWWRASGCCTAPTRPPPWTPRLDHRWLHEGQGTTSRLLLVDGEDVEHVARAMAPTPYVALHPVTGLVAGLADELPVVEIGPRRWGRRVLGEELVCLTTPWAGYRWGPVPLHGESLRVLPHTSRFDSRAETPRPVGLVGVNRSPAARRRHRVRRHPPVPGR